MSVDFDPARTPIPPGLTVIEASAGTGKTYSISRMVPRFLLDGTASRLREIVLVTFTNDAARELSERVRRVLEILAAPPAPDESVRDPALAALRVDYDAQTIRSVIARALLDIDQLVVATIHGWCLNVLRQEGTLCGHPVLPEIVTDASEITDRLLHSVWEDTLAPDARLTALAEVAGLTRGDAADFLNRLLQHPEATPDPDPRSLADVMADLQGVAAGFTPAVCDEVRAIFAQNPKLKKDTPSPEMIEAALQTLECAEDFVGTGFLDAIRLLDGCPDFINARSSAAAKGDLAACGAVRLASEALDIAAQAKWSLTWALIAPLANRVSTTLRENRCITYDGLVQAVESALTGPNGPTLAHHLAREAKVALIDESQDTDRRQFSIFRSIFLTPEAVRAGRRLILIGDPKQAIYGFRGADLDTYLDARSLAGSRTHCLTKTFRAPARLVAAVNAVFGRGNAFINPRIGEFSNAVSGLTDDEWLEVNGEPPSARLTAWWVGDDRAKEFSNAPAREGAVLDAVADQITRLLAGGATLAKSSGDQRSLRPGDIAVLVDRHAQAEDVVARLRARGVAAIRAEAGDIMDTDEAREIRTILQAVENPRRAAWRRAALATRLLGRTAAELANDQTSAGADTFAAWRDVWHHRGVAVLLTGIFSECATLDRLAMLENGERRIANIRQLTDLLQDRTTREQLGPQRLLRWFSQAIAQAGAGRAPEERQVHLESDALAVQAVTMHAAKGLEYPVVFCPFLWTGERRASGAPEMRIETRENGSTVFTNGSDEDGVTRRQAWFEERVRLAYVAITRARAAAWIVCGAVNGSSDKRPNPMDWLFRPDTTVDFTDWIQGGEITARGEHHRLGIENLLTTADAPGAITIDPLPMDSGARYRELADMEHAALVPLAAPRIPDAWGMTSFSAITREKDTRADAIGPAEFAVEARAPDGSLGPFAEVQGGAMLGTAVHDWMESWDFSPPDTTRVREFFARYPLLPDPGLAGSVITMLDTARSVILPGMACSLAESCRHADASEWHFQIPLHEPLTAARIAEVFARHGESDYAAMLSDLPVEHIHGYLHGFLDRIVWHEGTWGVIDWKTNQIGLTAADYAQDALMLRARRSHYILQTHLYLVALRRYLGPLAPIAGAWLVYLRGIQAGTSQGVLHIDPAPALLDELDALFSKPKESTATR